MNIKLSDSQHKLLISILREYIKSLDNMSCNDISESELAAFNEKELQQILEAAGKSYAKEQYKDWLAEKKIGNVDGNWSDALRAGWGMSSSFPALWLLETIKK